MENCSKFEKFDFVIISKYDNKVITETKEMIHECLKCEHHKQWCRVWYDMVEFLDGNQLSNDWK